MLYIIKKVLKVLSLMGLALVISQNNITAKKVGAEILRNYISNISSERNLLEEAQREYEIKEYHMEKIKKVTYDPDNLRKASNLSSQQIADILEGSKLQVLADTYYRMEKDYNINTLFLMALNIEESGHGKSTLAVNKNNLGGVKGKNGEYRSFQSWDECLEYIANLIDSKYLTEGAAYYNGTSIYDVNTKYCVGGTWATNLNKIANNLLSKVESDTQVKVENINVLEN